MSEEKKTLPTTISRVCLFTARPDLLFGGRLYQAKSLILEWDIVEAQAAIARGDLIAVRAEYDALQPTAVYEATKSESESLFRASARGQSVRKKASLI